MLVINGAGIAGLTLANCLQRQGIAFCLIEREPVLTPQGAGIVLQANGLAVLEQLGLRYELPGAQPIQMQLGPVEAPIEMPLLGEEHSALVVHRAELQRTLRHDIPPAKLKLGVTIASHSAHASGVEVLLSNGERIKAKWLIEASGVHGALHLPSRNHAPEYRDSGQWCWRTVVPGKRTINQGAEYWFGAHRVGVLPVADNHYYVFHVLANGKPANDVERLAWLAKNKHRAPLLANLDLSEAKWLSHPLVQRKIHWGQGRVVAIGDAAHALTPNLGQGAVLGMEDAYVLATLLKQAQQQDLAPAALVESYIAQRHRRVQSVQQQSWLVGRMAHWQSPLLTTMRNLALRLTPEAQALKSQRRWMNRFIDNMVPLA